VIEALGIKLQYPEISSKTLTFCVIAIRASHQNTVSPILSRNGNILSPMPSMHASMFSLRGCFLPCLVGMDGVSASMLNF
jgi:hypothetical protein